MARTRFALVALLLMALEPGCAGNEPAGGAGGAAGSAGTGGAAGSAGTTSCPAGYAECDGNAATVCETALASDPLNCGACGKSCTAGANQSAACAAGQCTVGCATGFLDCDLDATNGCEVDATTDAQHCGSCDRNCGATACSNSMCEVTTLASGLASPIAITVDQTHVYWANFVQSGSVMRVPKAGGAGETLAADIPDSYEVLVDGDNLYFSAQGNPPAANGGLYRMPKSGGTVVPLAEHRVAANEMCVDDTYIYWADNSYQGTPGASIQRLPKVGGSPEQVVSGEQQIVDVRTFQGQLYWMTAGTVAGNYADGMIVRSGLDGSSRTVLVTGINQPSYELGVTSQKLYFGSRGDLTVLSAPLAGGTPQVIGTTPGDQRSVEVAGDYLYVTSGTAGTLERIPLSGGAPLVLATGQVRAFEIVTDDDYVYWSDAGSNAIDGAIRRTAR